MSYLIIYYTITIIQRRDLKRLKTGLMNIYNEHRRVGRIVYNTGQ